ncbi:hypothetical protein ACWFMI_03380 [Nocardiopsis terrae]
MVHTVAAAGLEIGRRRRAQMGADQSQHLLVPDGEVLEAGAHRHTGRARAR